MRRDLDLIRNMLLAIEAAPLDYYVFYVETLAEAVYESDLQKVSYHIALLIDCNYIDCDKLGNVGKYTDYGIKRITSQGHDYLDTVRSSQIWEHTKKALSKVGGTIALEIVKALAIKEASRILGLLT